MNDLQSPPSASMEGSGGQSAWMLLFAAWLIAAASLAGSLFMDKELGYAPCELCWIQRIFMYPLVPVLLAGLLPLDRRVVRYGLPLAILGWLAAAWHLLLIAGFIPQDLQPCDAAASCAEVDLVLYGFLTIPMMSLVAFSALIALLIIFRKRTRM